MKAKLKKFHTRHAWDLFIGIKNLKHHKYYGFRFVEWPWSGFSVQWYWGEKCWKYLKSYKNVYKKT